MEMMKVKKGEQCVAQQKIEKRKDGTVRVTTINVEPSRTKQEFKKEVDANNLMKKYNYNSLPPITDGYNDLTNLPDLHEALETVRKANNSFQTLNAELRLRFKNDPNELIDFLNDPKNLEESIKLGLRSEKAKEDPQLTALKEIASNTKHKKTKEAKEGADD